MAFLALFMSGCKKNPEIGEASCSYVVCSYTIDAVDIALFFELHPSSGEAYVVTPWEYYYYEYHDYNNFTLSIPSHIYYNDQNYTVTRIGRKAFYDIGLSTLIIPYTVVRIENDAFGGSNIPNLICMATTPPSIERSSFDHASLQSIYVPNESVNMYKYEFGWQQYAGIIVGY